MLVLCLGSRILGTRYPHTNQLHPPRTPFEPSITNHHLPQIKEKDLKIFQKLDGIVDPSNRFQLKKIYANAIPPKLPNFAAFLGEMFLMGENSNFLDEEETILNYDVVLMYGRRYGFCYFCCFLGF